MWLGVLPPGLAVARATFAPGLTPVEVLMPLWGPIAAVGGVLAFVAALGLGAVALVLAGVRSCSWATLP